MVAIRGNRGSPSNRVPPTLVAMTHFRAPPIKDSFAPVENEKNSLCSKKIGPGLAEIGYFAFFLYNGCRFLLLRPSFTLLSPEEVLQRRKRVWYRFFGISSNDQVSFGRQKTCFLACLAFCGFGLLSKESF